MPRITLIAPDGARDGIYLYGAHFESWGSAGDHERLFLSQASQLRSGAPIRGGIPVVFPQFDTWGQLPLHGLARLMPREYAGVEILEGRRLRFSACAIQREIAAFCLNPFELS